MNWPARKLKVAEEPPAPQPPQTDEARCRGRIAAACEEIQKVELELIEARASQNRLVSDRPALEARAARGDAEAERALDTLDADLKRIGRTVRGLEVLLARFTGDRDEAQAQLNALVAAVARERRIAEREAVESELERLQECIYTGAVRTAEAVAKREVLLGNLVDGFGDCGGLVAAQRFLGSARAALRGEAVQHLQKMNLHGLTHLIPS